MINEIINHNTKQLEIYETKLHQMKQRFVLSNQIHQKIIAIKS